VVVVIVVVLAGVAAAEGNAEQSAAVGKIVGGVPERQLIASLLLDDAEDETGDGTAEEGVKIIRRLVMLMLVEDIEKRAHLSDRVAEEGATVVRLLVVAATVMLKLTEGGGRRDREAAADGKGFGRDGVRQAKRADSVPTGGVVVLLLTAVLVLVVVLLVLVLVVQTAAVATDNEPNVE
jgi:hypothetical protein